MLEYTLCIIEGQKSLNKCLGEMTEKYDKLVHAKGLKSQFCFSLI